MKVQIHLELVNAINQASKNWMRLLLNGSLAKVFYLKGDARAQPGCHVDEDFIRSQ
jgi:hypothetical protein